MYSAYGSQQEFSENRYQCNKHTRNSVYQGTTLIVFYFILPLITTIKKPNETINLPAITKIKEASEVVTTGINNDTASDCATIIGSPGNRGQELLLRSRRIPLSQIPRGGHSTKLKSWSKHSTSLQAYHNHGSSIFTPQIARRPGTLGR